jgi:hypothetical protein
MVSAVLGVNPIIRLSLKAKKYLLLKAKWAHLDSTTGLGAR